MSGHLKQLAKRVLGRQPGQSVAEPHSQWISLQHALENSDKVIDLGCGAHPIPKASVGVDRFPKPEQRLLGDGENISSESLASRGVTFIQADLEALPFATKSFDFAYSHHVFEHLPDPKRACLEMQRIARSGAIITPSIFAEHCFGRPYHFWLVVARGHTLFFFKKTPDFDRPFGNHPTKIQSGEFQITEDSNPFDLLLNSPGWYKGPERMPRLSRLLRHFWQTHHPVMEVAFFWEETFDCVVVDANGNLS